MPKTIALIDDHEVVRLGIRHLTDSTDDIRVVAEAGTAAEGLDLLRNATFDGLVLDLSLPDRSGLDVLRVARSTHPLLPILIYSMHSAEQFVASVVKAGARGYVAKCSSPATFIEAIRVVLDGGRYFAPIAQLPSAGVGSPRPEHELLTNREFQVFERLAKGATVSNIAEDLSRSIKTVSSHRASILSKMGLRTNADLTYYAIKRGLIE